MAKVEKAIEVNVPVETAYNQWTQFEEFPRFMEGVQEVHQVDDARLTWVAEVGGRRKEWFARITRQVPDEVIAWESEGGVHNNGMITFHRKGPDKTEVDVAMDYDPEDFIEKTGDKLGVMGRRVEGDLKRFKEFIESRGMETGGWRGRIEGGQARSGESGDRGYYGGTGINQDPNYTAGETTGTRGPGYSGTPTQGGGYMGGSGSETGIEREYQEGRPPTSESEKERRRREGM